MSEEFKYLFIVVLILFGLNFIMISQLHKMIKDIIEIIKQIAKKGDEKC